MTQTHKMPALPHPTAHSWSGLSRLGPSTATQEERCLQRPLLGPAGPPQQVSHKVLALHPRRKWDRLVDTQRQAKGEFHPQIGPLSVAGVTMM